MSPKRLLGKSVTKFQVIGMVHVAPLLGSYQFGGELDPVIARAVDDAQALDRGGVDGILVENFHDAPFYKGNVPPETVSALTVVAEAVRETTSLPLGINVLRNDPIAALAIARVIGGAFIRVNVHMGVYDTDQGRIEGQAARTLRYRDQIGARDISIWTDARVKHAVPVAPFRSLTEEIDTLVTRGCSDAIILTGVATGKPIDLKELHALDLTTIPVPVLVGSGVTADTIKTLSRIADGAIVGTACKRHGNIENEVDEDRVKKIVTAAART